jgi:hypothetical protein
MKLHRHVAVSFLLVAGVTLGCSANDLSRTPGSSSNAPDDSNGSIAYPEDPALDIDSPLPPTGPDDPNALICRPEIKVDAKSRALVVTDPEVLERFSLGRVLNQLISRMQVPVQPLELMQYLFDTQNSTANAVFPAAVHCDSPDNLIAGALPTSCPRTEGKLANSSGFLTPGHADYFYPVALINRFDLAPRQGSNCGEHRIIYAKWSGRTNPNERVFLAFEASLANPKAPDTLSGCRPVAKMWASLADETDMQAVADRLEAFYFEGIEGFMPVVLPEHYGLAASNETEEGGGYGDPEGRPRRGQLRVSQGLQDPWEFREYHLHLPVNSSQLPLFWGPVRTKNNPVADLFDSTASVPNGVEFRQQFLESLPNLAQKELFRVGFAAPLGTQNAGTSQITSNPALDFTNRAFTGEAGQTFWTQIQSVIAQKNLDKDCPTDDPLLPEHLVQRVSMLACAGCHAPEQYLGPSRSVGCGQTWPSIGQRAHIDEFGKLSTAMTESFLPRRADVMSIYLQACDLKAMQENLEPAEAPLSGFPD